MVKKLFIGCVAAAVLLGGNYLAYRASMGSHAEMWDESAQKAASTAPVFRDGVAELPWPLLERTRVDAKTHQVSYADDLKACVGKKVRITGVLCVLPNLVVDGKARSCVLMPPSKIGCCGITCDPRPELMIFVECKDNAFAPPAQKKMAMVTGELELQNDDSSWCMYTLNGAQVTLLP